MTLINNTCNNNNDDLTDLSVAVVVVVFKQTVELLGEVCPDRRLDELHEPCPVSVVYQPVIEDSHRLVHPESLQLDRRVYGAGQGQRHALNHSTEVSQVEEIVRLGRRWQEVVNGLLVQSQRCIDDRLNAVVEFIGKARYDLK